MSYLSLRAADLLYQCALSRRIDYHLVDDATFYRFWMTSHKLKSEVDLSQDSLFSALLSCSNVRFQLATTPLPFNHSLVISRVSDKGFERIARQISVTYPSASTIALDLAKTFRELVDTGRNPLLDCLEEVVNEFGGGGVVARDSRLASACRLLLTERPSLNQCQVLTVDELRTARTLDRCFVFGPTSLMPDHVFSAPRAPVLHVIAYKGISTRWRPVRSFLGETIMPAVSVGGHEADPSVDTWPERDWDKLAHHSIATSSDYGKHNGELVEARLLSLSGGVGTFIDVSTGSKSLVIDPEADGDARVLRVVSDEIVPGNFILLRTEGSGDYIVHLANRILGSKASSCRQMQQHWKDRLRAVVEKSEQAEVNLRCLEICVRLIDLGAIHADVGNIRYWLSPRSISPREFGDFVAIMKLIGLEERTEAYWKAMRQILAAHHQSGRRLRRNLIDRVRILDLSELGRSGTFDVTLPEKEGGKFTAFLVQGRAPNSAFVPMSWDGRIFDLED